MGFIINTAQPAFAVSGGSITAVTSAFKKPIVATEEEVEEEERRCFDGYGVDLAVKEEIDKLVFKYAFAENSTGANDEARLCLKSIAGTHWDMCENYEEYISKLAKVWDKRVQDGAKPLKVNVVLPEEDAMVGEKGMRYFEACWAQEKCGTGIEVRIEKTKETDHDSTANAQEGYLGRMFQALKEGESVL